MNLILRNSVRISQMCMIFFCSKAINDVNIRADPKSLQREDSEAVWNELAFYRKQYNLLKNERYDMRQIKLYWAYKLGKVKGVGILMSCFELSRRIGTMLKIRRILSRKIGY